MIGAGTLYLFAKPPKLRASRDSEVDGEGEGRAGESTLPG
jgi:hypothetical protein